MSYPILSTAMLAALLIALYAAIREFSTDEPDADTAEAADPTTSRSDT